MAYNRKQRTRSNKNKSLFYGFGALGVTPVRLNGIDETWQNPNIDTKPLTTHKPIKNIQSFGRRRPSSAKYPNFKYTKNKKRKKKKHKKQSLLYYHHNDTNVHPPHSPNSHKLSRPVSAKNASQLKPHRASHSASSHDFQSNTDQNIKNDSESIQFELMKEHMFSLKQQISKQMNTNTCKPQKSVKSEQKKKIKFDKKTAIFVPTPSSILSVDNDYQNDSVHIKLSDSPVQNAAAVGSPKRPKHQSFQRPPDSGGSRPIHNVMMHKKIKSPNKSDIINQKQCSFKQKYRRKQRIHRLMQNKIKNQHIYPAEAQKPITLQSQLHTVNVGLSSIFASNTPRIIPLNKLMENPSYHKYKNIANVIKTTKRKKRSQRPWSSKVKKTKCSKKRTSVRKSKKRSKKSKRCRRPKSAPAGHRRHDYHAMQSYMKSIENNISSKETKVTDTASDALWNPFTGITMFELQYLISFLRLHQTKYNLSDYILDVLDKCLHFYVRNDSYETAWNAWNIIQKFLLPDNKQMLSIDKKLCREVLSEYQTQSRDLKHNHIDEALFDDIIQEIGLKIAENIGQRQPFTIAFEKYVIDIQQSSDLEYQSSPKHNPPQTVKSKRPQSAICTRKNDLIHGMNVVDQQKNIVRPQSALSMDAKKSLKKLESVTDTKEINVMTVNSATDKEENENEEMKYCLDGIIDEM